MVTTILPEEPNLHNSTYTEAVDNYLRLYDELYENICELFALTSIAHAFNSEGAASIPEHLFWYFNVLNRYASHANNTLRKIAVFRGTILKIHADKKTENTTKHTTSSS